MDKSFQPVGIRNVESADGSMRLLRKENADIDRMELPQKGNGVDEMLRLVKKEGDFQRKGKFCNRVERTRPSDRKTNLQTH